MQRQNLLLIKIDTKFFYSQNYDTTKLFCVLIRAHSNIKIWQVEVPVVV